MQASVSFEACTNFCFNTCSQVHACFINESAVLSIRVFHEYLSPNPVFFLQRTKLDREDIDLLEKDLQNCNDKSYPPGASKNEKKSCTTKSKEI